MRIIASFLLVIIIAVPDLFAQTEQGNTFIGGNTNLGISTTRFDDNVSSTNIIINPMLGSFVADNFVLGVSVPVSSFVNRQFGVRSISTSVAIAPFARYYLSGDGFKPFITGGAGFGRESDRIRGGSSSNGDDSNNFTTLTFGAGGSHFFNDKVALDLSFNYLVTGIPELDFRTRTFSFNIGISAFL